MTTFFVNNDQRITFISQINELSSKFVILILTISFQCEGENFIRQDSTFSFANFVKHPFSKLASPILALLKMSTLGECAFECLTNKECFSINFATVSGGDDKYESELLNADMFQQADKFATSRDFHHYNNKVSYNFTVVSLISK